MRNIVCAAGLISCVVLGCSGGGSAATEPGTTSASSSSSSSEVPTTGAAGTTSSTSSIGSTTSTTGVGGTTTGGSEETSGGTMNDDTTTGEPPALLTSPFGIASSHSSSTILGVWAGTIAETGITWLRGLDNSKPAEKLDIAEANGMNVAGIFYYSKQSPASFPVDDLPGWTAHVTDLVSVTKGRVLHWEVWNEPPNFSVSKKPEDYAAIVVAAHDAAKAVDPAVQVGLAAQSNNVNFLDRALLAGAQGHFDYVTVHPYEILSLVDRGWEAQYMSIVPTLRKMLAARDPDRVNAPVWFTEIGEPVDDKHSPEHQAGTLIKAYTMGVAQGVEHIHWFEGRDGDSGPFGLIAGDDTLRPSYTAMRVLIERLGQLPRYRGWLVPDGKYHGFLFAGDEGPVMVAWARPGGAVDLEFAEPVLRVDPLTGDASEVTNAAVSDPVIFVGVPDEMLAEAFNNLVEKRPYPWDGDFSNATEISYTVGASGGLHPIGDGKIATIDGVMVRDVSPGAGVSFTVDPNFLAYDPAPLRIEVVLRRNGDAAAGFNLKYESVSGYTSTGGWYGIPAGDGWQTKAWEIDDPQFVGKWGYQFAFDSDSTMHSGYSIRSVTVTKL